MRRIATTAMLSVLAVPALLAIPVTTLPSPKAHPVKPSEQLLMLGSFDRPVAGALADAKAARGAPTLSVRKEATRGFSAVAVTWAADKGLGPVTVQVRAKQGSTWTSWRTAGVDDQSPPARGEKRLGSDLVWLGQSRGIDVSVTSAGGKTGKSPRDVAVRLIDPGTSAADANPGGRKPHSQASADPTRPTIYLRDQWGADESIMSWPPEYNDTIKAGFLHHTVQATSYTAAQVPAMIRADYQYHAIGRGWGDIGYNFLVDYFGRIWQGRAGNVALAAVGAHTGGFNTDTFGIAMIGDYSRYYAPAAVQT
ncbi:MAG: N-acetylmuramoyl-L-alanine amidase, partial [Actinomycetota bacterium]|nr:N-acetylmuramoyl-L-alanine amidase [Actinomycetota bacterium]